MTISDVRTQTLPPQGEIGVVDIGALTLESGTVLDDVSIAVQRWGELANRDNVVMVLHALTGDSHVTGPAGPDHPTAGWWDPVVGPGAPIDTDRWCVVATNALGGCRGSTGPGSPAGDGKPWGSRFPATTIRDQVAADLAALAALGITEVAAVIGGSMGGARALGGSSGTRDGLGRSAAGGGRAGHRRPDRHPEHPDRGDHGRPELAGRRLSRHRPLPDAGLDVARRIAHLTYRGEAELDRRFANTAQDGEDPAAGGRYAVQSYLEYQGGKLVSRFDAGSYVALTDALSGHDVGRGRGGVAAALRGCPVPAVVGGITSDRLYPLRLQQELADLLPGCDGLSVIDADYGHDSFLLETDAVAALIRRTLALAAGRDTRSR